MSSTLLFSPTPARIRLMLKLLAVIFFAASLGSAASIWLAQDRIDRQTSAPGPDLSGPHSPDDSRRYAHDVEVYYGETGLRLDKWERWLGAMTQRKALATTIAVLSVGAAVVLFRLTANPSRAAKPPAPDNTADRIIKPK